MSDGQLSEFDDIIGHWIETRSVINLLTGRTVVQVEIIDYDGYDNTLVLHLDNEQVVAVNCYGLYGGGAGIWYFILDKPND